MSRTSEHTGEIPLGTDVASLLDQLATVGLGIVRDHPAPMLSGKQTPVLFPNSKRELVLKETELLPLSHFLLD